MAEAAGRPRKPSFAERRERRAAVDDPAEVVDAAARFLEARPRSVAEVRRRLLTAGYRAPLVDVAIERLTGLRYLDDEAFARAWVESRDRARPRGEIALRRELRLKGVEASIVEGVLDQRRGPGGTEAGEGDPDADAAERLLARHTRALERVVDPRQRRQRAWALLARHGFDPETASRAAARFAAGGDSGDQD